MNNVSSIYKNVITSGGSFSKKLKKANFVYLDSSASTPLLPELKEVMDEYNFELFANSSSNHSFGRLINQKIEEAREIVAKCLNASKNEIYFTSGATESLNLATLGYHKLNYENAKNKKVIVGAFEHKSSLYPALSLKKFGCNVYELKPNNFGQILPEMLDDAIKKMDGVDFVSIMLVNNETGIIQPIEELVKVAKKYDACFLCDAVAACGKIPIDVNKLKIDMLVLSAHKFYGPKGCGILYIKRGTKILPQIIGGGHENNIRSGTHNAPAIIATAFALKKAIDDLEIRNKHYLLLKNYLYQKFNLLKAQGIDFIFNSTFENSVSSVVSVSFKNVHAEQLAEYLSCNNIMVSIGSACSSKNNTKISHVIDSMNIPFEYAMGTIRISFSIYNEISDIDLLYKALLNFFENKNK